MTKDLSVLEAQLHNLLMQSKSALSEAGKLCEEIQRLKSKPKIDWAKMPVDTLAEVLVGEKWVKRYFAGVDNGIIYTFINGETSKTSRATGGWDEIRLIENEPKPWFGGECPIPDGVRLKVWLRGGSSNIVDSAPALSWKHARNNSPAIACDIIAYQILGEE